MKMAFDASLSMMSLSKSMNELKVAKGMGQNGLMTFHCEECNVVLGDSSGFCGEVDCMDSIMCLRVTQHVVVSEEVEMAMKGRMAYCYNLISNKMVNASKISFDLKPLLESIKQEMQQIRAQADRMSLIEKRLSERDASEMEYGR